MTIENIIETEGGGEDLMNFHGLEELKIYQEGMENHYLKEKDISFYGIIGIGISILAYLICIKKGWLIDYEKFVSGSYYTYSQLIIGFVLLSLLLYFLKLLVGQFKLSSNILNNLKHKGNIINSYKLLFREKGSEAEKIELNKLIIEKTTEHLFKFGDGTHYGGGEKNDIKIYEKILDILPKLK